MLRRHGVKGGVNRIIEYHGARPGRADRDGPSRHREHGRRARRDHHRVPVRRGGPASSCAPRTASRTGPSCAADAGPATTSTADIDLSRAGAADRQAPSSPGNVVPVREAAGRAIYQVVIGSSANPGLRDFAIAAAIVEGRQAHDQVSFDVNPTSRQIAGRPGRRRADLSDLIKAGARIHQAGCMGCIGMGQAPATGRNSLRTVPRNFPGRSGTGRTRSGSARRRPPPPPR